MKYKLLAADMDGTLLDAHSQVSPRTQAAVLAAMERGVLFVPSTGRPMCGMQNIQSLFPGDLPCILYNGAVAMTCKSKKILLSQNLDEACAHEIYRMGIDRGYQVVLWENEQLHVSEDCQATRLYRNITGATMQVVADISTLREVTKMIWIIPPEEGPRLQEEIHAHFGGKINCHTSRPYLLEFVDAKASKGLALAAVGKAYGIAPEEMIAVGDGYNDVSMLEYAGLGAAMGNAPEDIKALCQHVTSTNDNDGVAVLIEKFILG